MEEIPLQIRGPVDNFTVQCDLEKDCLSVWGTGVDGFFKYELQKSDVEEKIIFHQEKGGILPLNSSMCLFGSTTKAPSSFERLSLGNHKAQDWDLVKRRLDLTEIFPSLYRLAQSIPSNLPPMPTEGMAKLLHEIERLISSQKLDLVNRAWKNFILAAFQGILTPYWIDKQHQGIVDSNSPVDVSPLILLKESMRLIRLHFIEQNDDQIQLLPALPPEFHYGRMIGVQVSERGSMDLEWTKKVIRQAVFYSRQDQEMSFHFKKVKSFRFKKGKEDKGIRINSGQSLLLEKKCCYFFDNFL